MADTTAPEAEDAVPFHDWLSQHRKGALSQEMGDRLAELLTAVEITGKGGSLTLTIKIDPKGRNVVVIDEIKAKIPEADREAAVYWITKDGTLVRDDPGQGSLFQRDNGDAALVDTSTGEVHQIKRH